MIPPLLVLLSPFSGNLFGGFFLLFFLRLLLFVYYFLLTLAVSPPQTVRTRNCHKNSGPGRQATALAKVGFLPQNSPVNTKMVVSESRLLKKKR